MAYNAVVQADNNNNEAASEVSSVYSRSSSPPRRHSTPALQSLSSGLSSMQPARLGEDSRTTAHLGSLTYSTISANYDMAEDKNDDYDAAQTTPTIRSNHSSHAPDASSDTAPVGRPTTPERPPLRSHPSDHSVPLSHPTPDLQSLQGAYVGNVERLERSAEHMSMSSADIGSEIRRIDREQKRRSSSVASNQIHMGNKGAFSPSMRFSSRRGSLRSGTLRSASGSYYYTNRAEVDYEPSVAALYRKPSVASSTSRYSYHHPASRGDDESVANRNTFASADTRARPATSASMDTYQQANTLFHDFDGVHCIPETTESDTSSLPPRTSMSESFVDSQVGQEDMVHYPAPIPATLNLPPRLSQKPASSQKLVAKPENHQTQTLDSANENSAAPELGQNAVDPRRTKRLTRLPTKLRKSAFFNNPAQKRDLEANKASAVAILDSVLDESAHAPVTAFTDHPYVGRMGSNVYEKSNARPNSGTDEQRRKHHPRNTLATPLEEEEPHETSALRDSIDGEHVHRHRRFDSEGFEHAGDERRSPVGKEEEASEVKRAYKGQPTTLIAELQSRKQELAQRRRTAAASTGMHSTLLQLDAVSQKQKERRRNKHVTLAWEAPRVHVPNEENDEDVPLGLLFPEKNKGGEDGRPTGLIEKLQVDGGEPLSRRRARLRGEPPPMPVNRVQRVPVERAEPESEDEGETLAQRLERIKADRRVSTFSAELLSEINSRSGLESGSRAEEATAAEGSGTKPSNATPQEAPPEQETLGQRRSRLQTDASNLKQNTPRRNPRARRSVADLFHRRPAHTERQQTPQRHSYYGYPVAPVPNSNYTQKPGHQSLPYRMSTYAPPFNPGYLANGPARQSQYTMANPYPYSRPYNTASPSVYHNASMSTGNLGYGARAGGAAFEPGQRDMVNRWRQSIVK